MSLHFRMLALMIGVVLLSLALVAVQVLTSLQDYYLREREVAHLTQGSIIGGQAMRILTEGTVDGSVTVRLAQLATDWGRQLNARVLVLDPAGKVLADTFADPKMLGSTLSQAEVLQAAAGEANAQPHYLSDAGWVMYAATPVFVSKQVIGIVMLSAPINDVATALQEIARRLLYVAGAGLGVAAIVSYAVTHGLTRPLARLGDAAKRMAKGDFGVRVPVRGASELARVGRDFNTMAERLDELEDARRTFIADASHELRTPLSSIKALLDPITGEHAGRIPPEQRDELMQDIAIEVDRMDRMAGDLLDLARLDEADRLVRTAFPLADLVRDVVERQGPHASRLGVELEFEDRAAPQVKGDELRLSQAVHNLVDNALKFTPPGGSVRVVTRADRGSAVVEVLDTGPGIPKEHIPHLFERFYRVDPARTRGSGGTGLGLAIVHRIVSLHGGQVEVESEPGQGSLFRIRLPG